MAIKKKNSKGVKNRRDAHGVYQRRAERGKASFGYDYGREEGASKSNFGNDGQRIYRANYTDKKGSDKKHRNVSQLDKKSDKKFVKSGSRYSRFEEQQYKANSNVENIIAGRNPVIEAIKSGREIEKIYMAAGAEGSVVKIRAMAKDAGVVVDVVPRMVLDRLVPGEKHQGVAAEISAYSYTELDELLKKVENGKEPPFIIVLDEISDPHNLGAIIRTAECADADGIIIPKRNACGLTATVAKTSAGALESMPVARVTNIARTIETLQERGIWCAALDMDGKCYYENEEAMKDAIALVIGSEGKGISRLVKAKCDLSVSIPMKGRINSLNASNAAAIMMYAVRRSRDCADIAEL